jgi:hypothetical protein
MKTKSKEMEQDKSLALFFGRVLLFYISLSLFPITVTGQDDPAEIIQRTIQTNRYLAGWSQKNPSSGKTPPQNWTEGYTFASIYLYRSGGPHIPHIMITLQKYNSFEEADKEYNRALNNVRNKNPEILAENFGLGSRSMLQKYFEIIQRDGRPTGRPAYQVDASGEGWLLKIIVYNRLDESVVDDLTASRLIRSLAESIFNLIRPAEMPGPPLIQSIHARVQHLSRTSATITIITHVKYAEAVGNPRPGDVLITLRTNDEVVQLKPGSEGFSASGYDIRTESILNTEKTGLHSIYVELLDTRYTSSANRSLNYEDRFKAEFSIHPPVAEVKGVSGIVEVIRKNDITRKDGILFVRDSPGRPTDSGKNAEALSSAWLYDGDQVQLADLGERITVSENHDIVFPTYSSIHLEWDGGVEGQAIYRPGRYTVGGGQFTIGTTRGLSGEITNRWGRNLSDYQILFTQNATEIIEGMTEDQFSDQHDSPNLVDWVLRRIPVFSRVLTTIKKYGVFSWHAGNTVLSDIHYLELNSEVYIKPEQDATRLNIFVLEGNPVIHYNRGNSRIDLQPGNVVTCIPGRPATTDSFNPGQMERFWEEIHYVAWDKAGGQAQIKEALSSDTEDQFQPIDLDLAADIMRGLLKEREIEIPSLQASVTGVRFYEGGYEEVPYGQRIYDTKFSSSYTRVIWWEINLAYPDPGRKIDFSVEAFIYRPDGTLLNRQIQNYFIQSPWTSTSHSMGFGGREPGTWIPGKYLVELFVTGEKVGEATFEIAR